MPQTLPTSSKKTIKNTPFSILLFNEVSDFINEKFEGLNNYQKIFISIYAIFTVSTFLYLTLYLIKTGTRI
jgi:hypothetical protein